MDNAETPILNTAEAAQYLGVSANLLKSDRAHGHIGIPFFRVGDLVKYRRADLDAWIDRKVAGKASA